MNKKVVLIVLDSVGVGALPDADKYDDVGTDTLDHISEHVGGLRLPNMEKMGLGHIEGVNSIEKVESPTGAFGRSLEASKGKDTITGHWEISGVILDEPLRTYPNGFPSDIIEEFEEKIGRKIIGNKVASGTEIIKELGEEHVKTGCPIVYTSADSVFQIAAHEEVISVDELYKMCKIAREMLVGEKSIGRIIARPFVGEPGEFVRTANRHDYALEAPGKTILEYIKENNKSVMAVGKINDIFNGKGVTDYVTTADNQEGVDKTIEYMKSDETGLIFTNLVDFDMKFGHRNDPTGYAEALKEFDARVPELLENLGDEDILIITADHGCDPTTKGTDHTREYIPILVYGKDIKAGTEVGTTSSFCDIGKTVLEALNIKCDINGVSFLKDITK